MHITILGVDLGKNVCSVVGLDRSGRRGVAATREARDSDRTDCQVAGLRRGNGGMLRGASLGSHIRRARTRSSTDVSQYVRPYIKSQKNDDRDAEGIAEAATRPTMRFVDLKSQDQLDMQTLHRTRERLVAERTALINQLRAILLERGLAAPQGKQKLERFLVELMEERGGEGLSRA